MEQGDYPALIACRVYWENGQRTVAGALFGNGKARLVAYDDFAVDAYRAPLCGRQAIAYAQTELTGQGRVEETLDYKNKYGLTTALIAGIQKVMFIS